MEKAIEGLDAARRAGWARAYAAERRVAELEAEVAELRSVIEATSWQYPAWCDLDATVDRLLDMLRAYTLDGSIPEHYEEPGYLGRPGNVEWFWPS